MASVTKRTSGFTKYRLHSRIPVSAAEAERFLWHALEHLDNLASNQSERTAPNGERHKAAMTIHHKIHLLQLEQEMQASY